MDGFEISWMLENKSVTASRFAGVFSADTLPEIAPGQCLVCNTDPSSLPGKHWISIFRGTHAVEYFDPLGKAPETGPIREYFHGKNYVFNSMPVQSSDSELCGLFCVFFLFYRCYGYSMASIVDCLLTDDVNTNEFIVRLFGFHFMH